MLLMLGCCLGIQAQGPNGSNDYYANANGYKGSALKTKLCKIIYKSSNPGYDALLEMYHKSDKRPDGYLRDWYSDTTHYVIGGPAENHSYNAEGQSYNREHTVPQSWFSKQSPMKSDGHHVVPTDGYVNNRRGNYPFGEVDPKSITYQSANGYSKLGRCKTEGYTGQVFEPANEATLRESISIWLLAMRIRSHLGLTTLRPPTCSTARSILVSPSGS